MALSALRAHRLRSALTMTGVAIGVFSVIGVMTALGAMQHSIESGLSFLGSNIFQFAKYPAMTTNDPEIEFANRRDITLEEAQAYKRRMEGYTNAVCLKVFHRGISVAQGRTKVQGLTVVGTNEYFLVANQYTIGLGRNLSPDDVEFARRVAVVGQDVQKKLFPSQSPLGQTIQVAGMPYQIVGVTAAKGSAFGNTEDDLVLVPITRFFGDYGAAHRTINIATQSTSQATYNATLDRGIGALRVARGLKLDEENDFAIYSNDSLVAAFASVADQIRVGAFVVSTIALLAAGIGIMNIMLVSVTERTREIGLRKALGARRTDVARQFLLEAVVLCEIGGLIGIGIGIAAGNGIAVLLEATAVFPWGWALTGIVVCSLIGVGFGFYPAWKAASLNPIEALRFE